MTRSVFIASFSIVISFAAADTALAQETAPKPVRAIHACRGITDPQARLACFDAAADELDVALDRKQVTILDKEAVQRTKRSLFGFTLPSVPLFGRSDERDAPEFVEINTTVSRVTPLGNGKYELFLPEGARWQTTETSQFPPQAGAKIRIKKAALGSYFIFVDGGRPIRGHRVG